MEHLISIHGLFQGLSIAGQEPLLKHIVKQSPPSWQELYFNISILIFNLVFCVPLAPIPVFEIFIIQ